MPGGNAGSVPIPAYFATPRNQWEGIAGTRYVPGGDRPLPQDGPELGVIRGPGNQ